MESSVFLVLSIILVLVTVLAEFSFKFCKYGRWHYLCGHVYH